MLGNSIVIDVFWLFYLWPILIFTSIIVWLAWIYVDPEYIEDGVLTRGSCNSIRARAFLTGGCMVFWVCIILGIALSSGGIPVGFYEDHPVT